MVCLKHVAKRWLRQARRAVLGGFRVVAACSSDKPVKLLMYPATTLISMSPIIRAWLLKEYIKGFASNRWLEREPVAAGKRTAVD
jgi:hypothetical protein